MSTQPPPSDELGTSKGPRGTKLWLILLVLVSVFGGALYLILTDDGGFSGPAQVGQLQKPAVQTSASAPTSSPLAESYSYNYPAPGIGNPQASKKAKSPGTGYSAPMAAPSASSDYPARIGEGVSTASSGSNDNASDRSFGRIDQYSYSPSHQRNRNLHLRQIETGTADVQIVSYTDVPGSSLAEVLQKPQFEIKLRTAKRLKLGGATIESGEYILKPRLADNDWQLLFLGSNNTSPAPALTLTAGRAPSSVLRLSVFIRQRGKQGALVMLEGADQLTGYFEIE